MSRLLTINGRLIVLGVLTALAFLALVAAGWSKGQKAIAEAKSAALGAENLKHVNDMRLANGDLVLAAMDSIIDKAEGAIQPDRQRAIEAAIAALKANTSAAITLAGSIEQPGLTKSLEADIVEIERAIAIDLPLLVRSGASIEEFASLDDAIDGAGQRLNTALGQLSERAEKMLQTQLSSIGDTARSSAFWLMGLAAGFLVTITTINFLTSRFIKRSLWQFGRDMEAIADGKLDTVIAAQGRNDEIGRLASSLSHFRNASLERLKLETEAAETRQATERERLAREQEKAEHNGHIQSVVAEIGNALNRLSAGDLSFKIATSFGAGLDTLREDFNRAVVQLNTTLAAIQDEAIEIKFGSEEMRAATDDLARRTEQQAASLEQTSASLDEITATVRSASARADEASLVANTTQESTLRSRSVVNNAVGAMSRIEAAALEISSIISVIEEIAFQTNLLALNAGVEAARAGEAGKGFAVVAQEVRELAQRSAVAAKDIKALITKSSREVAEGVQLVNATGDTLNEISNLVTTIHDHIHSIATSAREQSSGLAEINDAINQLDQVTQQNAAMVEEAGAVMHRLASGSLNLSNSVGRFAIAAQLENKAFAAKRSA